MKFNYYSFFLRGEERIYYTYVTNDTEKEILEWAARFGFIHEDDIPLCSNARLIPEEEVKARNDALYKDWWNKHKDDDFLGCKIPPTIGEAQLN